MSRTPKLHWFATWLAVAALQLVAAGGQGAEGATRAATSEMAQVAWLWHDEPQAETRAPAATETVATQSPLLALAWPRDTQARPAPRLAALHTAAGIRRHLRLCVQRC